MAEARVLVGVTMAATFTVSAKPEVEFVRSVAKRDEHNPFDVCSPSEKLCQKKHPCQIGTSGDVIWLKSSCLSCTATS